MLTNIGVVPCFNSGKAIRVISTSEKKFGFHDLAHAIPVGMFKKAHRTDAGIVDQNVKPAELRLRNVNRLLPHGRIGDVACDNFDRTF